MNEILQPPGWSSPKGYANGVSARGRLVFTAGQIGWDTQGNFPDTLAGQVELALANVVAVLAEAGAGPEHLVRLTWFIIDRRAYLDAQSEIGAAYRRVLGRHYPAMSLVEVSALVESKALVEIEATAVIPD
ncbi:MAG: RidA family protein [Gammaproteobacteria bacterium]|nr:RidA family protein [Gammaproteobacteria bacterium]MXZ27567.1 RidA family protein [Gammaproteobacteria bacterium]MYF59771.1 RidA family protein [Gammaproteobacteria bacterium]